jgi:hypothetical protein
MRKPLTARRKKCAGCKRLIIRATITGHTDEYGLTWHRVCWQARQSETKKDQEKKDE